MELSRNYTYAIVGASNNPEKFGYKVMKDWQEAGFTVVPINLKETKILGQKVYPNLSAYPEKIDVVVFIVPPPVTLQILPEVVKLGIKKVWFQPGSESDAASQFCQNNGLVESKNACLMRLDKSAIA